MTVIPINLSTNDLLKGVEQLGKQDLEEFVKQVLQIRARRLADTYRHEEATLMEKTKVGLSEAEQLSLQAFANKSQNGSLSEAEQKAYLGLTEKMETLNNQRLEALGKLAQLRDASLETVMEQFGLTNTVI
jgi:hypothetical protein